MTNATAIPSNALPSHRRLSQTARAIEIMQLHGYHPNSDEPDLRPLPEDYQLTGLAGDLFDLFTGVFQDTRLEPDLDDLLWSLTNLFHGKADRVQRQLDANEDKQRASQAEQDGSEVKSVELERLLAEGGTILERRAVFEALRDLAAEHFEQVTGSVWRPRKGSMVNHKNLTAAMIDSRDFIAAKRKAETEVHLPQGPKVAFSGGIEYNDHKRVWAELDKVHAKHPAMVLIHGGTDRGAEKIAACWAKNRKVPQIAFKPDFERLGKAAPFKRNDKMLETLPIGVIIFPGSGITGNLADKARQMRIPVKDFRKESGA